MAMTKREYLAKNQIIKVLKSEGYPTYAGLVKLFDINLTKDPETVAYMIPNAAKIVINEGLDIDAVSMVVRHEILHEYLAHQMRMEKHMGKDVWDKRTSQMHQASNIAGDYEISNRGYTDKDKATARAIKLNGEKLRGLVTEDDHPDWVDLPLEDMYDKLTQEMKDDQNIKPKLSLSQVGNQAMQDLEEIERQANAISNDAGEMIDQSQSGSGSSGDKEDKDSDEKEGSGSGSEGEKSDNDFDSDEAKELKKNAEKVADAADKLGDAIEKEVKNSQASGEVFGTESSKATAEKIAQRVREIQAAFDNVEIKNSIFNDINRVKEKEDIHKIEKNIERYRNDPLTQFKISLAGFIKKQTSADRDSSWRRTHKSYTVTGTLRPGRTTMQSTNVPILNVYFDRSGSWDADKTKVGEQALANLNQYEKAGKLKVRLYYFDTKVKDEDSGLGGGTDGQPILDHIERTKPDNVMIMTDSDIDDCTSDITVPGAVWLVFKGGTSQNLIDHIHGRSLNKIFELY